MHPRLHVIRDDDMQCAFNGKHCSCRTWTFAITRSFRISRFQTKCASSIKFNPFDLRYGFSERSRHGAFGAIVRCDQLRRDQKIQWTKYYIRFTLLIILDSPVPHRRRHIIAFDYATFVAHLWWVYVQRVVRIGAKLQTEALSLSPHTSWLKVFQPFCPLP